MKTHLNQIVSPAALAGITLAFTILPTQGGPAAVIPNRPAFESATQRNASATNASALARDHWQSIATGDVAGVMAGYGPAPVLHWDGGAFDGDHVGAPAIQAVWSRFARARAPLQVQVQNVREKGGAGGSRIVTANAVFRNHDWTYPVVYQLVFRQGRIVEETWHIADADDG
ncbi:MAG: nuclear transport factor 2 family protein, partial [Armatimonadetes bacterium]|nr:nuclear transport factor 2 family protein [Armatimonadota bacterium]